MNTPKVNTPEHRWDNISRTSASKYTNGYILAWTHIEKSDQPYPKVGDLVVVDFGNGDVHLGLWIAINEHEALSSQTKDYAHCGVKVELLSEEQMNKQVELAIQGLARILVEDQEKPSAKIRWWRRWWK